MGVLDEAIREHLDLKRQHGAAEDEIARQEAEALGPARRDAVEALGDPDATLLIDPVEGAPAEPAPEPIPPSLGPEPDVVEAPPVAPVHDIDEDPLAPPPPVERAAAEPPEVEDAPVERPAVEQPELDEPPPEPPPLGRPSIDAPIRWPREKPGNRDNP